MQTNVFKLPKDDPLKLVSYLKKYSIQFWIQAAGGIIYNTVIVSGPILLGYALDAAGNLYNLGATPERIRALAVYCILFVLSTMFFQFARYVKRWYIRDMSNRIACDMRSGLVSRTLGQNMETIDKESVGDLMSRTVGDVEQIVSTMQSTINETWDTWLLMISYFVVLLFYNPYITLICSIPIPAAIYIAETVRHRLYKYSVNSRKAASVINSHLQNTLNGISTLRLFGREEVENERLKKYSTNQMEWSIKVSLLQTGMMPVYSTLASLGVVGVIGLGGRQVIEGSWSIGHFTAYLTMFIAMSTRTWVAARVFNQFHGAKASWDRIKEKLNQMEEEAAVSVSKAPTDKSLENSIISVKKVSFKFPKSENDVLRDISFKINPGDFIGVTGPVGSGKSALAAVLTGLYPYEGEIKVQGRELREFNDSERVEMISYSGQDSFLFSASITENITFDENMEACQRLMDALHISALADDMELFPDGVKTMVGEKGVRVSGGQRQRISLSRALYTENPILILDDPFSAVDIGTEKRMVERIREKLKGRTIILFSHRLSSFKNADNILVLDKGRIAEHGNHDELMELQGIYQRIYSAQHWMEDEANE